MWDVEAPGGALSWWYTQSCCEDALVSVALAVSRGLGGVCGHRGSGYRVNVTEVQERHEERNKPCRS